MYNNGSLDTSQNNEDLVFLDDYPLIDDQSPSVIPQVLVTQLR